MSGYNAEKKCPLERSQLDKEAQNLESDMLSCFSKVNQTEVVHVIFDPCTFSELRLKFVAMGCA